jgi:hypothetical protein
LGNARFVGFADAVNDTGRPMVISTEPFSLIPTSSHSEFSHLWRTTNDINPNFHTILDRADTNDKWADLAAPGGYNDPDMLEIGNGGLTDGECRVHFALWSAMKSPLILGTNLPKLSQSLLAIIKNSAIIAVNQDSAGIQAKKLLVDGMTTPRFVGLAPCDAGPLRGRNGVSSNSIAWTTMTSTATGLPTAAVLLVNTETNRCLTMGNYSTYLSKIPLLLPCNISDVEQAWILPTGAKRLGALLWAPAVLLNSTSSALSVGATTLYSTIHGSDTIPVPDVNYGLTNISLAAYAPEPPCDSRGCDNYAPEQNWYWSPRTSKLYLGLFSANNYRCFGSNCYRLTGHEPTLDSFCLSHVLSYDGNVGTDPAGSTQEGVDVWGGALSGTDAYTFVLVNRALTTANITAPFLSLEANGVDAQSTFCATELYSGVSLGKVTGSVTLSVPSHDAAMLRLGPSTGC